MMFSSATTSASASSQDLDFLLDESRNPVATTEVRPVALLDVDQTLINDRNEVNELLMADLLKAEVRDVYLFTHMSLSDITEKVINPASFSRKQLIEALEARGFTVHGVLTPADPAYNRGLGAAFNDMYLPHYQRIGKPLTEANIQEDGPFQKENTAFRFYIGETKVVAERSGHHSVKGEMYKYFLQNRPAWVGSVLFFDDAQENLDDALLATKQVEPGKRLKLTTVKVNKRFNESYAAQLSRHLPQPAFLHRIKTFTEAYPRTFGVLKWLVLGAALATLLYFSGGLAALPYVAELGAWAIPVVTPVLALAKAALWSVGKSLLKFCGFPRSSYQVLPEPESEPESEHRSAQKDEVSVSPTHQRVLRELEGVKAKDKGKNKDKGKDKESEKESLVEEQKDIESAWYTAEQLEKLIYSPLPAGRSVSGLRYVFMAQDYNGDPTFKAQLAQLRILKNKLKAPFACFITTEPGQMNTSHFVMGILINKRLVLINPIGETTHRPFYEQMEGAREKLRGPHGVARSEGVIVSTTPIQNDPKALVSCGPICVELLRHFASLSGERLEALLEAAEKTPKAHDSLPEYQTIDLLKSGLLPPSLQGLLNASPREYEQRMQALRERHAQILASTELAPEAYDERNLMNQMVLKEVDLFSLEENEAFKRLRPGFASSQPSFGSGSSRQFVTQSKTQENPKGGVDVTIQRLSSGSRP